MPLFDIPLACNLPLIKWKVYLRLAKHLSLVLNANPGEQGTGALFLALSKIAQPRVFWDIGANIGTYSWLLMSLNPDLRAVLFEPDPDNAWLLDKTISKSRLKNARLIRRAVSNNTGTAPFAVDKASSATGSLIIDRTFNERLFGHKPHCINVETTTLDEVWRSEGFEAPDLIKIDVELAEHLVFEGAMALIKRAQPVIVFECCSSNKQNLQQLLTDNGYILLGADYPDEPIETAYNLVAIPTSCRFSVDELLCLWREEYATGDSD